MDIELKEGAVCYADGECHHPARKGFVEDSQGFETSFLNIMNYSDFQLNTIKQGDCIEASEIDTEQKYNDAVEVFGLFGFYRYDCADFNETHEEVIVVDCDGDFIGDYMSSNCKRKLTYHQIMAIGELKRLEIERDKEPKFGKNEDGSMKLVKSNFSEKPNSCEDATSKQEVRMQKNKPVVAQVMIDLTERMEIGIKTYGEALRANNGRDALQDAYEEALDLACYLKQAMIEKEIANYEKALKGGGSL